MFFLNYYFSFTTTKNSSPERERERRVGWEYGGWVGWVLEQVIFHHQCDLPQQCDSRWQITWLMIEIWQNNTVFYNSVPKQKYGSRKLNSASSPPCQSQRFSIKGQIIVFCLPPSQLTAEVTARRCYGDSEKYLYWQGHKSHADKF